MRKFNSLAFVPLILLMLSGCQSLEQITIDYLQPAELSFPPQLRKVAIVNNTSAIPDNKLIVQTDQPRATLAEISRATAYANGDPRIATEAMAEEIARQNYFDKVVICDSALRNKDILLRESTLTQEEVRKLTSELDVDFIIALENLQLKASKTIRHLSEYGYQGAVDVKVYPTTRIYVPGRSTPMTTLHLNDSIFWEEFGRTVGEVAESMIPDAQMLREASEFGGTVPVKKLIPSWKKGNRYLYTGGSVQMRDAAVFARENTWDKAYLLWNQAFEKAKNEKRKMQTAFNIAVYYEMKDSLAQAEEWGIKAQKLAKKIDKVNRTEDSIPPININDVPNYYLTTLYVAELKERNSQLPKLKMQMSRFHDDF